MYLLLEGTPTLGEGDFIVYIIRCMEAFDFLYRQTNIEHPREIFGAWGFREPVG
jgi:hypothetical protein